MNEGGPKAPLAPATRAVAAGRREEWAGALVNPPVFRGSTHLYANSADLAKGRPNADGHFYYGRRGSPTQWALCEALTELDEGAGGTLLFCSGVAAISSALLAVLAPGDVLLLTDNCYEPTRAIAETTLKRMGIGTRYFDPLDLATFERLFCDRTRAIFLESPGSLTLEVCDVPAFAAAARKRGAVVMIDNTWAGPLGLQPFRLGCDISVMSLTKHVGGHSDLMMGSLSCTSEHYPAMRRAAQLQGQVVSPDDASLALRGLRTMPLRLERATASALRLAEWLSARPEVAHVRCPMLPGAPGHDLWARDFTGGCGLFSFVLKGRTPGHRSRFIDALRHFGIGFSWGGFESLVIPFDPVRIRSATSWPPPGWDAADCLGIRLSVGLEDADDLLRDLSRAFAAMEQA